jgi:serine/threonine-protein kinase
MYSPMPVADTSSQTSDELSRWNAPAVVNFRRKLAPFIAVNALLVPISIFSQRNFFIVTIIWGIALAVKYSRLWSAGYDWHDVFRQPRDRLFADVAAETIDDARALFDEATRERVRARARARAIGLPLRTPDTVPGSNFGERVSRRERAQVAPRMAAMQELYAGTPYADLMREARNDHAEIHRQLLTLTSDEREQMPEVGLSADAVLAKMQNVARNLTDMERSAGTDSPEQVEGEITRLESEANPLDHRASEDRVRRLAYLRRQRRALVEVGRKREEASDKLEHCRQLLKSMRMELLRYRSGGIGSNPTGLTMVTQQAQGVVREMGYLSDAAAELNAL